MYASEKCIFFVAAVLCSTHSYKQSQLRSGIKQKRTQTNLEKKKKKVFTFYRIDSHLIISVSFNPLEIFCISTWNEPE